MERAKEKGFDKFTEIAQNAYRVIKTANNLREDLTVVIMTHSENTGDKLNPYYKMKTIGRMLDNVITLEGLFNYVLFTTVMKEDGKDGMSYMFITNSDGTCTAKTPMGMFPELYIPNDLDFVIKTIKEYEEG